ncbi:MAG TPA: hypothetical protein VFJ17_00985 [Mycobacteriales bacterium]|jgi:hypothetical protein|nr:hypothetical protein [Mycobacteriales bacterium]
MAWWRRRKPAHASVPVRRQATWAAPAFPPEVEQAVAAAVAAPAPVVPEQRTQPAVRLGFDDGSEMHLSAEDPRARALQAVADLLVKTEPLPPTTNNEPSAHDVRRIV